jgi:pyruvate/2-oxoglutarate dehydrogenase complex dihydrolipoamide dehydrogenase (E3) component
MNCDICVIGAGSGGLTVAAAAAKFGRSVILIEQGKMGGDCLNYGCIPSKALIAAARRVHAIRGAEAFGIPSPEPRIDFSRIRAHVREVIAAIEPKDSETRFLALGVKVIRAHARFVDGATVEAGGEQIKARRFVLAAGSSPAIPPIPGLVGVPYLTNETIFDLRELPRHLFVLGSGPVGIELGQAFRRLGSEVSIIEAAEPLGSEDPELAAVVLEALRSEGVAVHSQAQVAAVREADDGVALALDRTEIKGSHLLIATGRQPNVEGLGLDEAGIAYTAAGIAVDAGLKTTNRKIYAIGDVVGGPQFTHLANYHAGLVIRNALFRLPVNASSASIPRIVFTDPELAQIGLTEAEARARYGSAVSVARSSFMDNDRAQIERRTQGLIKIVTGRRDCLLGASIVGPGAGELIQPFLLAISRNSTIRDFASMIAPYPTLGEISKQAAIANYAGLAANPWIRHIIGLLASFG